jgi:hypothetical protein
MVIGNESTAISETVMTTPLLANADFSESATDNGFGGTNHPRRLADGVETASVEQVRPVLNTRPFLQFRLATDCIQPTLPLLLEQNGVTTEQWDDFWSPLKGLVQKEEQVAKRFRTMYGICAKGAGYILLILIALLPLITHICRRRRKILLDDIVAFCKASREAEAIQANGYTLECEILANEFSDFFPNEMLFFLESDRLHLFILPADKPYARFEVYNGQFTCQGWNDTYLNAQASTIPPAFDSVPLEDWSSFWTQLRKRCEPQLRICDLVMKVLIVDMLTFVMAILTAKFSLAAVKLFFWVSAALMIGMVFLVYRYNAFLGAKTTLVCDTAVRWAPRGVYMEHQRRIHLHLWLGFLERHYVYIFRLANLTDPVEDPDDSRSKASGIRSRQSIGISGSRLSDDPDA